MMECTSDKRRYERLSVGSDYGVSMSFQGRALNGVELQNISACGCGVKVPRNEAAGLEMGLQIDNLYLLHAGLPCVPLQATIVRLLGKTSGGGPGYVLLGLDFVYVSPTVLFLINRHVAQHIGMSHV